MAAKMLEMPDTPVRQLMRWLACVLVVLVVLLLTPYTPDPPNDVKNLVLNWGVLVLFVLGLIDVFVLKQPLPRRSLMLYILLAYLGLNFIAALQAFNVMNSLHALGRFVTLTLLYLLVAYAFRTPTQAWQLMLVLCAAVALSSAYGFFQKAGLDPFPWATREVEEYLRLPATFGNPNLASHALNLAFIMAVALALRRETRWYGALAPAVRFLLVLLALLALMLIALRMRTMAEDKKDVLATMAVVAVALAAALTPAALVLKKDARWYGITLRVLCVLLPLAMAAHILYTDVRAAKVAIPAALMLVVVVLAVQRFVKN
ncbi:MAG TPA: hypothetical protein ENN80_00965, partial [Candidatus Hydrogenedentes bacterium]|nr:hypothetical protein [Candidatus Hydrogenedentota bacterium]